MRRRELHRAERLWATTGPNSYEIAVTRAVNMHSSDIRLTIAHGRLVAVECREARSRPRVFEPVMPGSEYERVRPERHTVPALLSRARDALAGGYRGTETYTVEFHPKWGFPSKIQRHRPRGVCDGGFLLRTVSFKPIDGDKATEIHALAGSAVSGYGLVRRGFAFIALCRAAKSPRVGAPDSKGTRTVRQEFEVVELMAGQTRGARTIEIEYQCEAFADYAEQPVRKEQSVIWVGRRGDKGQWMGIKAGYNTFRNRRLHHFTAYGPTHHSPASMDWFPWVSAVPGLACRLGGFRYRYCVSQPIPLTLEIKNVGKTPIAIWSDIDVRSLTLQSVIYGTRASQPRPHVMPPALRDTPLRLRSGQVHCVTADVGQLGWGLKGAGPLVCLLVWRNPIRIGSRDASPTVLVSNPLKIHVYRE